MDIKLMEEIKKIPGFENKQIFQGAYVVQPNGKRTARPSKMMNPGKDKIIALDKVIDAVGLKDGMTISFHHALRNGDLVMQKVIAAISKKGIKNLTLSASSLSLVQDALLPYFENETIIAIDTSGARGKLGKYIQSNKLKRPAVFRTHGGRARAIETGELHIDVAFIAAPTCDKYGNINGVQGKSACGSLGYAMPDSEYADYVVAVTDGLSTKPLEYVSIPQTRVDYIVEIDNIGDPAGISTGSIRTSKSPTELVISKYVADVIKYSGVFKDGITFQFGSGGIAISAAGFLQKYMEKFNVKAAAGVGGATSFLVDMLEKGYIKTFFDPQDFDQIAIKSLYSNRYHHEISASDYANPFNGNPYVNILDTAVLSATEVDINFNVNVLTDSYGKLMGAPGGHPDAAAGAKVTIIAMPLLRGRLPMIVDKVQTIVTPGETVDIVVTDYGIAVNPKRNDLSEYLKKSNLPLVNINDLYSKALKLSGKPQEIVPGDKICGLVEYRDGTIIDVIRNI